MCILLLFPFHTALVFSAGWFGYYVTSDYTSNAAFWFIGSVDPWIMPLLFCVAGLSTKFALQKRTPVVYLKERVTKLLVPFLAGLVLICPIMAYYALKFHAGFTGSYADAFLHFFSSITTNPFSSGSSFAGDFSPDHLWFILFLFIISVLALGVILLGQKITWLHINADKIGLPVLVLLFIPVWLLNFVGFSVTGYSFLSYFAMFLIGYYLIPMDSVQALLEKNWLVLLAAWIILTIGVLCGAHILGYMELLRGYSALHVLTGWMGVLALMGAGRHLFNRTNNFAAYMGAASYPVYIIHQAVLVAIAYYVVMWIAAPALQFTVILIGSLLLTFACYEILKRIPVVRALFGIAGPRKKTA
jgi:peptidoglycan/LPS O-acetylase OafA/YrhL